MNANNNNHQPKHEACGKLSLDDARLTAYALDEYEIFTQDELEAIKSAVAADPELQAAVAEVKATAASVTESLAGDTKSSDAHSVRDLVLATATEIEPSNAGIVGSERGLSDEADEDGTRRVSSRPIPFRFTVPIGMAAAFLVTITAGFLYWSDLNKMATGNRQNKQLVDSTSANTHDPAGWGAPQHPNQKGTVARTNRASDQSRLMGETPYVSRKRGRRRAGTDRGFVPAPGSGMVALHSRTSGDPWSDTQSSDAADNVSVDMQFSALAGNPAEVDGSMPNGNFFQTLNNSDSLFDAEEIMVQFHDGGADISHLAAYGGSFPEGSSNFTETTDSLSQGPYNYEYMQPSQEAYDTIIENPFKLVGANPLSTFSIDVDTASYSNMRRYLRGNALPPMGAIRIEEMINYFDYDYPLPEGDHPFSVNVEVAECPWNADHRLARIGLKGYEVADEDRPNANLVFLVDVSGSMEAYNKLPLVVQGLKMLVRELDADDTISIVVYAGSSGIALPATACHNESTILTSLERLRAGGSTNGGEGIELAYAEAEANFIEGGINRVILATDGDFNVGVTNQGDLVSLIEEKAKTGVFLSVLGFGMGDIKDSTLEKLADKGNGYYAYIDDVTEAERVLVTQMGGTLMTIAKDVKIQVEFNPAQVSSYRLIGYENRNLQDRDFNDDTKDAGEIGAGHTVTALYELVPADMDPPVNEVDDLKYQKPVESMEVVESDELMTVKLRYKEPDGDVSELIEVPVVDDGQLLPDASDDFAWAAGVAGFGMILRGSAHCSGYTYDDVLALAESGMGDDAGGLRQEMCDLIKRAQHVDPRHR